MSLNANNYLAYIDALNEVGIALSAEKNFNVLLEKILMSAMRLTNADAGTLYLVAESRQQLEFMLFSNKTLHINLEHLAAKDSIFKYLPLYDAEGQANLKNIASHCYFLNKTINIADAYHADSFDFSGTKAADKKSGYHSKSFLVVPLRNHENKIIGILQLINAIDEATGKIIAFNEASTHLTESLASQAAITLTQQELINAQKKLFEAFIQLIAKAIDEKSVYTSRHCSRVPVITMLLADALLKTKTGPYKNFQLTTEELEELRIAAWLHDCGKVSTPEYVMDKATKLAALTDRIEVIELRFEILRRDAKIAMLEGRLTEAQYQKIIQELLEAEEFLHVMNIGGEFLAKADQEKIQMLAKKYSYNCLAGNPKPLLDAGDIENLSIARGTLTERERDIINNHVSVTLKMLQSLPYPDYLKNVPEIAGSHHERLNGQGYPRGLTADTMSVQARIVAIADIFEALTAADRPYKKAKKLSETLAIMQKMQEDGHIDSDLFNIFVQEKIYLRYAKGYLANEQLDIT